MVQYYRIPGTGDPSPVVQHFPAIDIVPLCCHFWWLKDWRHSVLSFPYWRFYWNANPGAFVTLHGTTYHLDAEHIVILPPNTPFSTGMRGPEPPREFKTDHLLGGPASGLRKINGATKEGTVYHFFIHFSAGIPYDDMRPTVFRFRVDETIISLLHLLLDDWQDEVEQIAHRQGFLIKALLAHVLAKIPSDVWPSVPQDQRIRVAAQRIEDAVQRQHPNHQLAELAGMSANAFARLFKKQTGKSPQHYLRTRRIRRACVLLHHTDKTIDTIAEECGFCNRHYFTRIFTREIKLSPALYRKTH